MTDPSLSGKLIWLTGAPGLGKSTSAQILGRDHGFVYYEVDCFLHLKNPYVPLTASNPTMAQTRQKILTGIILPDKICGYHEEEEEEGGGGSVESV